MEFFSLLKMFNLNLQHQLHDTHGAVLAVAAQHCGSGDGGGGKGLCKPGNPSAANNETHWFQAALVQSFSTPDQAWHGQVRQRFDEPFSPESKFIRQQFENERLRHLLASPLKIQGCASHLLSGCWCNNAPVQSAELPHLRADEKRLAAAAALLRVSQNIKQPFIPSLAPCHRRKPGKKILIKKIY